MLNNVKKNIYIILILCNLCFLGNSTESKNFNELKVSTGLGQFYGNQGYSLSSINDELTIYFNFGNLPKSYEFNSEISESGSSTYMVSDKSYLAYLFGASTQLYKINDSSKLTIGINYGLTGAYYVESAGFKEYYGVIASVGYEQNLFYGFSFDINLMFSLFDNNQVLSEYKNLVNSIIIDYAYDVRGPRNWYFLNNPSISLGLSYIF